MGRIETQQWYLYVILTVDNTLYTGITTNVKRRYAEHCSTTGKGAKYLRAHPPLKRVLSKRIGSYSLALKVEYRFKHLSRAQKNKIVASKKLLFDPDNGTIIC